ncbi:MAG: MFS transporter [Xanthomonadales bacterium]|nr:MFS transporter [Xanthomonadales bacterium]
MKPSSEPDSKTALMHPRTVFDGWRSISISLYMTLVGYAVLVGVPVISTAWVELLGFTEEQVGRVAGADLGGLSLGAVITALLVSRMNRRLLVLISVAIVIVSNGLCMVYLDYEQVLWLRVGAGVGSGMYTAVAVATLGGSSKPARAYNLMLFAFAFSQALEMQILPMLSMNGIYLVFIGCYLAGLPFLRWIPARPVDRSLEIELDVEGQSGEHRVEHRHVPAWVPWLVLAAIFFTYINIGAYWTYIELATIDAGIDNVYVGRLLVWTSFFSLVGCAVATVISNRFGLARPLLVALIGMAGVVGMLAFGINDINILISMFSFNLLWIFVDVYQMSTVANVDHSGSFASLMPGAQGLGQIVGPNIAATQIGAGMGYSAVFLMCSSAAAVGLLIYGAMYLWLRRSIPALAEAT